MKKHVIKVVLPKEFTGKNIYIAKSRIKKGFNYFEFPEDESLKGRIYRCKGEKVFIRCETLNPPEEEPLFIIPMEYLQEVNDATQ